ncbi:MULTISPECIES: polysaccharide deacetylase family protein [Sphingobium]|uniref:Polysaccharide deacetylase n=1 Tax=Sphingobium tyrosinilyticum TaxID=2715436 RepID=A0ABV9F3G3_9SPHN|nr:hypothetical protein [Sphingobium sp. EP60837]ANI77912.1 hypothetical protein EP837_01490 [Sphingobium sp. EP60837]
MTDLLITIDTELSALLHERGVGLDDNVRSSIWGVCAQGRAYGIGWQMDELERHGLRGVFFLDPMPALVHGTEFLKPIVAAIARRGHEVQLHIHSEWLRWASGSPLGGRQGRNIGDFALDDQVTLLTLGQRLLEQGGAPAVTAFRAGNFGANDDTLRALARVGINWDSSVNPAYRRYGCRISGAGDQIGPSHRFAVSELPVSGIIDRPGGFRPAQICAMSAGEMRMGLRHAVQERHPAFVVVTHSFEMLSRDRQRPNHAVMRRFTALCRQAAEIANLRVCGFRDLPPSLADEKKPLQTRVPPNRLRTAGRMAQQLWASWCYERRLIPA